MAADAKVPPTEKYSYSGADLYHLGAATSPPKTEEPSRGGYPTGTTAKSSPAQPPTSSGGHPTVEVKTEQELAAEINRADEERLPGPWAGLPSEVVIPKEEETNEPAETA